MLRVSTRSATAMAVVTLFSTLAPMTALAQPGAGGQDVQSQSGYYTYFSGGFVRGVRAKTQTSATTFHKSFGWQYLPNASLSWSVPAGTSDLFTIAYSAECRLTGGIAPNDWVRIRLLHNGVPIEPYDGQQGFCSTNSYATYKGNWIKRVGGGFHTIRVQFWIRDGAPTGALSAWIDDWTMKLVVYD